MKPEGTKQNKTKKLKKLKSKEKKVFKTTVE